MRWMNSYRPTIDELLFWQSKIIFATSLSISQNREHNLGIFSHLIGHLLKESKVGPARDLSCSVLIGCTLVLSSELAQNRVLCGNKMEAAILLSIKTYLRGFYDFNGHLGNVWRIWGIFIWKEEFHIYPVRDLYPYILDVKCELPMKTKY